ncbi:hypothetical protein F4781DRAFT_27783 [Annulohypoxylon bovei var. microspora]|nr:hypothetical protein F4781DRAFT_27783 [Annulohypoxylon bovei var. microspora]
MDSTDSATLNSDISQNTATHNATLSNVVINNCLIIGPGGCGRQAEIFAFTQTFLSQKHEQEILPMSEKSDRPIREYFSSLMQAEGIKKTEENPPYCQRRSVCLRGLNWFKGEIKTYAEQHKDRPSVLNQLSDESFGILKQWIGATDHQVLLVVGRQGNGTWTTNLLLEIIDVKPRSEMVPYTAHLCGLNFDEKKVARQEFLIEDLVAQLIDTYRDNFNDIPLPEFTMQVRKIGIKQLWDLFIYCVKRSRIKKLLIILDRIDYIFAECGETFGEFVNSLGEFCETLQNDGVIVKVMVISGHLKVAGYFKAIKSLRTIELHDPPS